MEILLYIIGFIIILGSVIVGILSGSFSAFLEFAAVGFLIAMGFFVFAKLIGYLESIIIRLDYIGETLKKIKVTEKKICPKCGKEYEAEMNSCPNCGNRD